MQNVIKDLNELIHEVLVNRESIILLRLQASAHFAAQRETHFWFVGDEEKAEMIRREYEILVYQEIQSLISKGVDDVQFLKDELEHTE
jgi:hypothetical protein